MSESQVPGSSNQPVAKVGAGLAGVKIDRANMSKEARLAHQDMMDVANDDCAYPGREEIVERDREHRLRNELYGQQLRDELEKRLSASPDDPTIRP